MNFITHDSRGNEYGGTSIEVIQLNAPKIWLVNEPVDLRKAANGLTELVVNRFNHSLVLNDNYLYRSATIKVDG